MHKKKPALHLRHLPLKTQFGILIACVLVLMLLVQVIYITGFADLSTQRVMATATRQMSQAAQSINEAAEHLKASSTILAYSEYVQELMLSDDPVRNYELYPYIMEMITSMSTSNPNIYSVFLLNNGTRKISDPVRNDEGMTDTLVAEYGVRSPDFVQPMFIDHVAGYRNHFYTYVFPIFHSYLTADGSKIGVGVLVLNIHNLTTLVQVDGATENSIFLLLDQENRIIVSSKGPSGGEFFTDVFWQEGDEYTVNDRLTYNGQASIAQYQTIESTGWKIVSIIPVAELTKDIRQVTLMGLVVSVLLLLVMLIMSRLTSKNIAEPVEAIADFLAQATEDGSLHQRLSIPYRNESGLIAEHINLLLEKVEQITQENLDQQSILYNAKLEEKQAHIRAMQSQINPHFLYNTLNCLSSIGLAYDVPEVVTISGAMSDIFRYSIKGGYIVTVQQELDCISKYLQIMDARYPGRFSTTFAIEEDILNCRMLKMTLQPIVENAMYHGLEQIIGHGLLRIEGRRISEKEMQFIVQDNGKGMSAEALGELKASITAYESTESGSTIGLGLRNIYKRIRLQLGSQYGFDIESAENQGTRVILRLPLMLEELSPTLTEE